MYFSQTDNPVIQIAASSKSASGVTSKNYISPQPVDPDNPDDPDDPNNDNPIPPKHLMEALFVALVIIMLIILLLLICCCITCCNNRSEEKKFQEESVAYAHKYSEILNSESDNGKLRTT